MSGTTCALQHRDIIGQVQSGRAGFGLGKHGGKATLVTEEADGNQLCSRARRRRSSSGFSQAKQGQWMNWHKVEKRKITWRGLWAMDAKHIQLIVGTTS